MKRLKLAALILLLLGLATALMGCAQCVLLYPV